MSKSSDKYRDPRYSRKYYAKNRERILAWRRRPEQKAKQRAYIAANPEQSRASQRRYKDKHRDKLIEYRNRAETKARRKENSRVQVLRQYGLTPETYDKLLAAQGGRCAICGTDNPGGHHKRFHVDHCHKSGKTRELLCNNCNATLGHVYDRPELLFAAAHYLLKHQPIPPVS